MNRPEKDSVGPLRSSLQPAGRTVSF
jgi:hypothetical protein